MLTEIQELEKCMHKFYPVSKSRFSACLYFYHSGRVLSFLSVISCVIQININPLILQETYDAKGQEK